MPRFNTMCAIRNAGEAIHNLSSEFATDCHASNTGEKKRSDVLDEAFKTLCAAKSEIYSAMERHKENIALRKSKQ